jgi:hypothetical protein
MLQTGGFPPLVLRFWQVVDTAPWDAVFALNVLGWGRVGMCQLLARSSWIPVGVLWVFSKRWTPKWIQCALSMPTPICGGKMRTVKTVLLRRTYILWRFPAVAETDHSLDHSNSNAFSGAINQKMILHCREIFNFTIKSCACHGKGDMKFHTHNQKCHEYHISIKMTKNNWNWNR